jgi:hypothetical protein
MMHVDDARRRACNLGSGRRARQDCRRAYGSDTRQEIAPRVAGACRSIANAAAAIAKAQARDHGVLLSANDPARQICKSRGAEYSRP